MSTINPYYTFQYSQPEEYRFSHDSIFLARHVFEWMAGQDISSWRGLDLCSGCGVIGLDFVFHTRKERSSEPRSFDFMEVQEVYQSHFQKNVAMLGAGHCEMNFLNLNYQALLQEEFKNKYDLILCNPPYFRAGQGKMSPSEFKNRCRFFLDADFESLVLGIENALAPGGEAYLLLRDLGDHGWNPFEEMRTLLKCSLVEKKTAIRGTDVVIIKK